MRYPVYVDGAIPMQALADAIAPHGFHIRIENGCRMVIDPVPALLRKEQPVAAAAAVSETSTQSESNLVRMPTRVRRAK